MDYRYYSLREVTGEHIGTVQANNKVDLELGMQRACESHFDCEMAIEGTHPLEDYPFGETKRVSVLFVGVGRRLEILMCRSEMF